MGVVMDGESERGGGVKGENTSRQKQGMTEKGMDCLWVKDTENGCKQLMLMHGCSQVHLLDVGKGLDGWITPG